MSERGVASYETGSSGLSLLGLYDSLASASLALPEGAYTTLRTYAGNGVVRLGQHLARLEESVALMGTPGRIDRAAVRRALGTALANARYPESRVRLTFAPPRLFIAVEAFAPLPEKLYEDGVACVTLELQRDNPHAKDTRFIAAAQDAYARLPEGVEEGLLVAGDGAVLEGLSSNFFAIREGVLRTEEDRALAGVTRSLAIEVAQPLLPLERVAVQRDELPLLNEAFITSVSREVLPVVRIDGRPVGDGRVGPRTRAIMQAFAALVARERESLLMTS
jgi:branched-subunit amino acid aminotransferase/4-amino-4-deoxychorismate lyase